MHTLFDSIPTTSRGTVSVPEFLYVKGGMSRDLAEVMQYYHERVKAVTNNHLLVRLIRSMNVSMKRDYMSFLDAVEDRALDLSRTLGLTSPVNSGEVHTPGVFYGEGVDEIIVSVSEDFDPHDYASRWRELQPIKVLRHPFTDITHPVLKGEYDYKEEGIAVIAIDIPKLMFQYRCWWDEEKGIDGEAERTTNQFIAMYPIPNMMPTHLDVAIFNRMHAMLLGEPVADFEKVHPFYVTDYTKKLDSIIEKTLALLVRKRLTFDDIMLSVRLVSSHNLFEAAILPKVAKTRQVKWALVMARLPLIKFLLKLNEEADNYSNKFYLTRIKVSLKEIRSDRTLTRVLPRKMMDEIKEGIKTDIAVYV